MAEYLKPVPTPDPDTKKFWEYAKSHELRLPRCTACSLLFYPPQGLCPRCLGDALEWVKMRGTGVVYSMSVVYANRSKGFKDEVPYIFGYVTLDEDVQMLTNILFKGDPFQVKIGAAVEVVFDDATPQVTLPKFRLRAG
ncbi:MAG: hypothetical protein EXR49_00240 [Dehalococcoidia bacterium]|nr:hypothetical protein [Dehalococcoidia bacterium]